MHILLGNRGHASLFESDKKETSYFFKKIFENKKMMEKESSIFTDRAGTGRTSNTSDQAKMGESHYKEELVSKFCIEIVSELSKLASSGELKSLSLICEPSFLGEFRKKITPILEPLINSELPKNFYTQKPHKLTQFLKNHDLEKVS